MAKDRIGLADIEARLGRKSAPTRYAADPEPSPEPSPRGRSPRPPMRAQGESSGGSTLFVSLLGVLAAGAAGAFLAMGGFGGGGGSASDPSVQAAINSAVEEKKAKNFRSSVADVCNVGWKDDRSNDDQIHCYMTRDVRRLCDPRERRALADKWRAYQFADEAAFARLERATMTMAVNPNVMGMGVAEARSHDPNLTEEERAEQTDRVQSMANDYMAPAHRVLAESRNTATQGDILRDVRDLAQRGFLAASDFPGKMPKLVKEALATAGPVSLSTCK